MANKITKRDNFNALLALDEVQANPVLVEFINHELELLDKKNKSSKTELSDTQKENIAIGNDILAYMANGSDFTIAKIRTHFGLSSQKVTPIMTRLVDEGKVVKTTDKRVSYYSLVG